MFCNSATDFYDRRLLKSVGANHRCPDLAGDRNQGNAVQFSIRYSRDEIRRSGSAGCNADTSIAGGTRVTLRRKPTTLLVSRKDGSQIGMVSAQRLMQWHACAARVGENQGNTVVYQAAYDCFRTINGGLFARLRSHTMPHHRVAIDDSGLPLRIYRAPITRIIKGAEALRIGALQLKIKFRGMPYSAERRRTGLRNAPVTLPDVWAIVSGVPVATTWRCGGR